MHLSVLGKKNTVKKAKQNTLRVSFSDFVLACMCLHLHENCSQNCVQFHAKITASIALLNLHKCTTSAAPLTPSAEESGFVWSQEIRDTHNPRKWNCAQLKWHRNYVGAITVLLPG